MENVIEIRELNKNFKISNRQKGVLGAFKNLFSRDYILKAAIVDLNLVVKKGEIVGYIGTNGAGKSTSIKMMTGIISPTSGKIKINGLVPHKNRKEYTKDIGVVFGQRSQLVWDIAVEESFEMLKVLYQIPEQEYRLRLNEFLEVLELKQLLRKPIRQMSLGERVKCEIAAAFLHNPAVVFLDEPTIGLDVNVKQKIRSFLKAYVKKHQTTVILTSHDMADITSLAQRIVILDNGLKIYDGDIADLNNKFGNKKILEVKLDKGEFVLANDKYRDVEIVQKNKWEYEVILNDSKIELLEIIQNLFTENEIADLNIINNPLEAIVTAIYEGEAIV